MRRIAFLIGLLLELTLLFGLFVPYVLRVQNGTIIHLKTAPVDPRSIFRGDYVALSYEAGVLSTQDQLKLQNGILPYGQTVYVTLEASGDTFNQIGLSDSLPALQPGQVCLRGQYAYPRITFPDIAQYFVTEGAGKELEQARNTHRLVMEVAVDKQCRAVITGLQVGEAAPLEDGQVPQSGPPGAPVPVKVAPLSQSSSSR